MNLLATTSWGLLWPAGLILLPLIVAVLIYAYLRQGQSKKIVVPTLMILRALSQVERARQKIRLPWRFFFELMVLLLLLAGATGLYRDKAATVMAIVLDNSLSMSLIDTTDPLAQSLLEIAKRDLSLILAGLPSNQELEIFTTSPVLKALSQEALTPSQATRLLDAVAVIPGSDDLTTPLKSLASAKRFAKITVLTDKFVDSASATPSDSRIELKVIQPQQGRAAAQNIAINEIALERAADGRPATVKVWLSAYIHAPLETELSLAGLQDNAQEFEAAAKIGLSLKAGLQEASFAVPPGNWRAFRVSLAPPPGSPALLADWIRLDNFAWITVKAAEGELILVSPLSARELGLSQLPQFTVKQLTLERIADQVDNISQGAIFVFHRFVPDFLSSHNFLLVYPQNDSKYAGIKAHQKAGALADWKEHHPILSYLNLPLLQLKSALTLKGEAGAEELIATTDGPVLLAYQDSIRKYAVFGFELFPFRGKASPLLSILTLNALSWLGQGESFSDYQLAPFSPHSVEGLSQIDSLPIRGPKFLGKSADPLTAGLYQIAPAGLIAVNYFDQGESNVSSPATVSLPTLKEADFPTDQRDKASFYFATLATLVLAALIMESVFLIFVRWQRSRV